MTVRGVEIEVRRGAADSSAADHVLGERDAREGAGAAPDEETVRATCRRSLTRAREENARTVALAAIGIGPGGVSPAVSAKIMVQESIRLARTGATSVERITIYCQGQSDYEAFDRTAEGYIRHFLDVLLWGPLVTVDAIIELAAGIVLIRRKNPPLGHALPGGFVDYGESLEAAVRREAKEETGLDLLDLEQFHTYSDPTRDPRFHTVTTVFSARAEGAPRAGDDAADVLVVPVERMEGLHFAFDHGQVLRDWARRGDRRNQPRGTPG